MAKSDLPALLPQGLHQVSLAQIREICVDAFPLSRNRSAIMAGLERVVQRLKDEGVVGDLWIDGSFLTKAIDPADVDLALSVSAEFFDAASPDLQAFMNAWFKPGMESSAFRCDAFLFCEFAPDHPCYREGIRDYWLHQYGTGHDEVTPKGIAVLQIGGAR